MHEEHWGHDGARTMIFWGKIEIDLKYEERFDLRGCLEAVVASEAAKRVHTI